jgi:dCTP deaminase
MAVWNYQRIKQGCILEQLVTPFDIACINPASLDLRLGASYRLPDAIWQTKGTSLAIGAGAEAHVATLPTWGEERTMQPAGFVLYPGQFILCCSMETVAIPNDAIAFLYSKSSTGRRGLEHLHAGLGDPGFKGQWTFEFHNVAPWPILLVPGAPIMQMVVEELIATTAHSYAETGRYQNQVGATPAREAK